MKIPHYISTLFFWAFPPWGFFKTFGKIKAIYLWFYNRKKLFFSNFFKIEDFFLKKLSKNMVFWRPFLGNMTRDPKILSNYSFYIDIYPIFANFCENGYYGCNLQFLVAHEIFWWNSDLFRALNFVNRSSGSKIMQTWFRVIYIYIYVYDMTYIPLILNLDPYKAIFGLKWPHWALKMAIFLPPVISSMIEIGYIY